VYYRQNVISDMALPFETMAEEARKRLRQDRLRRREVWDKGGNEQRFYYEMGSAIGHMWKGFEDAAVGLNALEAEGKEQLLATVRGGAARVKQAYKRAEMASKFGLEAVDKVFDRSADLQDLDEDEQKLMKEYIKEQSKTAGGKMPKKYSHGQKPYEDNAKAADKESLAGSSGSGGGWGGGMSYGQSMNMGGGYMQSGFNPMQGGWPNMMPMYNMQASGGIQQGYGGGYGSSGGFGGGGGQGASHTASGGSSAGVLAKKKHPCDNCGSLDHRKYQPVCPNFHIHLAQQEAKHMAMRGGQQVAAAAAAGAQPTAGGDGTVALLPRQGEL